MKKKEKHNNCDNILKLVVATSVLMLSACSTQYTVSTNLDKENFQNYFSHVQVEVVKDERELSGRYKLIGLVEGQSCQVKTHHAAPDEVTARTDARRQAFKKQANAIVFTGCALIPDDEVNRQCEATMVCFGKAYQVEKSKEQK
jgi:RcsF protein